jgi:hypothetical protein
MDLPPMASQYQLRKQYQLNSIRIDLKSYILAVNTHHVN